MNVLKKYMITASLLLATTAGCGVAHSGGHQPSNAGGPPVSGTASPIVSTGSGSRGSSTGSTGNSNNTSDSDSDNDTSDTSDTSDNNERHATPPPHHQPSPHVTPPSTPPHHQPSPHLISLPTPTETIGHRVPCLNGYVWRSAFPNDYVCVLPAVRTQAAADNAAAISRIAPNGGAYGPYTCKQGYVWRQAVHDDYVCVLPAVRAQAAADNAQADNRDASLHISVQSTQSTENLFTLVWHVRINGDHFNFGQVKPSIYDSTWHLMTPATAFVTAASRPGLAGGSFAWTYTFNCSLFPGTNTFYASAYDTVSHRPSLPEQFQLTCPSS